MYVYCTLFCKISLLCTRGKDGERVKVFPPSPFRSSTARRPACVYIVYNILILRIYKIYRHIVPKYVPNSATYLLYEIRIRLRYERILPTRCTFSYTCIYIYILWWETIGPVRMCMRIQLRFAATAGAGLYLYTTENRGFRRSSACAFLIYVHLLYYIHIYA